ncbi:nicotinate-nucleotide adenylyltransferase [Alkalithermobacter thermoalcaliphilus JW-YL-7 = DSM 7308]|uniref:Probable nicotinate-nucleotide adenylyltransferase n=1 Tax=Alkalithermobacter thermoalcaliphilus JW-YL-7 = DSM 7308 TaxID=1121328 RepID=A0A150FRA9_CLOPD|nr:nicotinate-nucleotide adenylyltransferase [[Clostridium] paradoxum JW-YL-7 = DSM 7308]SHL02853.1 nicotinate-nucleotide adenylyltransferase [[Clostridium] paradoxum JW-YL-7 = DSM 7308]
MSDIDSSLKNALKVNKEKGLNTLKDKNLLKKIGIMGGTFNPIHYGHLSTAEHIREKFELDKIIFIPSSDPPHKNYSLVIDKIHRYNMCVLGTYTNSNFYVSDIEIQRGGKSYTVDTLTEIKQIYTHSKVYFITGADALCEIETWKDVSGLFQKAIFIGATRPGFIFEKVKDQVSYFIQKYNAQIFFEKVPLLDISSTELREKIKNFQTIKYLLPEDVEKYIDKYKLYR